MTILRRAPLLEQEICVFGAANDDAVKSGAQYTREIGRAFADAELKQRLFALDDYAFHNSMALVIRILLQKYVWPAYASAAGV